jgi:hypothetical protein
MAKIVVGFFEQVSEFQRVLQELLDHGFERDYISIIARQNQPALDTGDQWAPDVIAVPGVGPVMATGPLAASLTAEGGDPSGTNFREALEEYGVPTDESQWYLDAVRAGGVLTAVEAGDAEADRAADIMNHTV